VAYRDPVSIELEGPIVLAGASDTQAWGRALAARLRAGDVVVLTGELGAGKTTLTQGLAEGLGVRGPITSPTFVIARVHPSLVGGPALVHADAYRLGGALELDDLDLDASTQDSVTVVEWGHGLAESLADSWLEVELTRALADERPLTTSPKGAMAPKAQVTNGHLGAKGHATVTTGLPTGAATVGARAMSGDNDGDFHGDDGQTDAPAEDPRVVRLIGHGPRWEE
jgi:tRNA threonylcarbamoyladenosine biosynthesis protein TsaE